MKHTISRGAALLLLGAMPFEIDFAPADSAQTAIQFFGGVGQYALIRRGCEGQVLEQHEVPFRELNAAVEHKFAAPIKLGVRGSYLFDKQKIEDYYFDQTRGLQSVTRFVTKENLLLNPYLNIDLSLILQELRLVLHRNLNLKHCNYGKNC